MQENDRAELRTYGLNGQIEHSQKPGTLPNLGEPGFILCTYNFHRVEGIGIIREDM